jgi:hypothetical protein
MDRLRPVASRQKPDLPDLACGWQANDGGSPGSGRWPQERLVDVLGDQQLHDQSFQTPSGMKANLTWS